MELILFVVDEYKSTSGHVWPAERWIGKYEPLHMCPFYSVGGFSFEAERVRYWMPYPELPEE